MLSWALQEIDQENKRRLSDSVSDSRDFLFVPIDEALFSKKARYFCPDCFEEVRPKHTVVRRAHFFHLSSNAIENQCRSSKEGKTGVIHASMQEYIKNELIRHHALEESDSVVVLEKVFPSIRRVADIAYMPSKVVFEVQVSPIEPNDALKRVFDYWRLGWHVIWILYDRQFYSSQQSQLKECFEKAGVSFYFFSFSIFLPASPRITIFDSLSSLGDPLHQRKKDIKKVCPVCISSDFQLPQSRLIPFLSGAAFFEKKSDRLLKEEYRTVVLLGEIERGRDTWKAAEKKWADRLHKVRKQLASHMRRWWISILASL